MDGAAFPLRRRMVGPVLKAPGTSHPWQRTDCAHPVGKRRDEAKVILDVLFAYPAGWDYAASREGKSWAVNRFQQEYTLSMVPESPVPEVSRNALGLVDYLDSCWGNAINPMLGARTLASIQLALRRIARI
jgi:hypothetical protein